MPELANLALLLLPDPAPDMADMMRDSSEGNPDKTGSYFVQIHRDDCAREDPSPSNLWRHKVATQC